MRSRTSSVLVASKSYAVWFHLPQSIISCLDGSGEVIWPRRVEVTRRSSCDLHTFLSNPCFHYPITTTPSNSQIFLGGKLVSCCLVLSTCKHFCLTCLLSTKSLIIPLKIFTVVKKKQQKKTKLCHFNYFKGTFQWWQILTVFNKHQHCSPHFFITLAIHHSPICLPTSKAIFSGNGGWLSTLIIANFMFALLFFLVVGVIFKKKVQKCFYSVIVNPKFSSPYFEDGTTLAWKQKAILLWVPVWFA